MPNGSQKKDGRNETVEVVRNTFGTALDVTLAELRRLKDGVTDPEAALDAFRRAVAADPSFAIGGDLNGIWIRARLIVVALLLAIAEAVSKKRRRMQDLGIGDALAVGFGHADALVADVDRDRRQRPSQVTIPVAAGGSY